MKFGFYKRQTEEEFKAKEVWQVDFAWFPIRIGDSTEGHWIWLEKYLIKPRFSRGNCFCLYGEIHDWEEKEYEEKSS